MLICLEGPARVEPVTLYSGASPFVRVEGEGRCEIDVPQQAVVMREAGVMYVRSSCLAGFEGDFRWMQTDLLGTAVLHLEGAGTILMNSVRRGRTIEVRADRPVHVRRDAFLAWTAGVEAERFSGGAEVSDLVVFRGEGRVVIAGLNTEDEGRP